MFIAETDVRIAFLNDVLNEEIWVTSPRDISNQPSKCYKLYKVIYSLKQAHFLWHTRLCGDLWRLGYEELSREPCVTCSRKTETVMAFVLVYVDNILILWSTASGSGSFGKDFRELYKVITSRNINCFLRTSLHWSTRVTEKLETFALLQPQYVNKMFRRFEMGSLISVSTSMIKSFWSPMKITTNEEVVDPQLYQKMVGSHLLLVLRTRPDMLTALTTLSCFQKSSTAFSHSAMNHLSRYHRETSC